MKYIKKSHYLGLNDAYYLFIALVCLVLVVFFAYFLEPESFENPEIQKSWLIIISLIAAIGFTMAIYFYKVSAKFQSGRMAEHSVKSQLSKLDDSYTVFHNFVLKKGGDVDFVVVGPTGIFAIEVKRRGWAQFEDVQRFMRQANWGANKLRELIEHSAQERVWVNSVVSIVGKYNHAQFGTFKNAHVISPEHLARYITSQPRQKYRNMEQLVQYLEDYRP